MAYYYFEEIILNDLLIFSNTKLPLANQGLILVKGDFESKQQNRNSNEAGKSLLFASIPLLIQGQLPTGKLSVKESTPIDIELKLKIDDIAYNISLKKNKYSIKKDTHDITPHKKPDALNLIKSLFPEETLFNSVSFVSQFSPIYASIIGGSPALRSKIIEEFLDQSKIDMWKERLKEKTNKLQHIIDKKKELNISIRTLSREKSDIKKSYVQSILKKKQNLQYEIATLRKKLNIEYKRKAGIDKYNTAKRNLKVNLSAEQIKNKIQVLTGQIDSYAPLLYTADLYKLELDIYISLNYPEIELFNIPYEIKASTVKLYPKKVIESLLSNYEKINNSIGKINSELISLSSLANKKQCPTCKHALDPLQTEKIIQQLLKKLNALENKRDSYIKDLSHIKATNEIFTVLRNIDSEVIANYAKIKEISKKQNAFEKERSFLNQQLPIVLAIEHLKCNLKDNSKVIANLENKIDELEKTLEITIAKAERLKEQYKRQENLKSEIKRLTIEKEKIKTSTAKDEIFLPILSKAMNSRELKTKIMIDFCNLLVSDWNLFANNLFTRKITFSVGIERGYPAFRFVYDGYPPTDIRHLSGGAKKRLIACMIPSLLKISPSPTNILVIDELDANIDDSGKEALLDFFPYILESELGKDSIFFLTARNRISHANYVNWTVKRKDNISRLIKDSYESKYT